MSWTCLPLIRMECAMKIRNYSFYNQETDIDDQFYSVGNTHYNVGDLLDFDPASGKGEINFLRNERKARFSFNLFNNPFETSKSWTFPPDYEDNPNCPMQLQFVSERCVRFTMNFSRLKKNRDDSDSPMIHKIPKSEIWTTNEDDQGIVYKGEFFTVKLSKNPFSLSLYTPEGKLLTKTLNSTDSKSLMNYAPLPLSFVENNSDLHRHSALSLKHSVNEHFYGCGESFSHLDKSGQKFTLWTQDGHGSEGQAMYKPVPFYYSNRGYGVFVHSGSAMTFDFGWQYAEAQTLFVDDDILDVFFFIGDHKQVLTEYTNLTGAASMPPLWSFGLWMSRITYNSEEQARDVAKKLKEFKIPCDVIHLDTGWFETDWRCDYKFSASRFDDAEKMIRDLAGEGYKISLWQLPYFTPENPLFNEILKKGYAILNADKGLPSGDAILDMSNPSAVAWYQEHLQRLFDMGVAAIKVDFGEAAPKEGVYHSGASGRTEHNLYPLRYNKAVYDVTKQATGDGIIWARSAWAGSQRYPIHWGGDTENTDMGMLSVLRGCLSLGMSGFSFTSHDAGGFVRKSEEELYRRWMFLTIFTSHMRCHGLPPKEPWAFSESFLNTFREQMNLRYSLTPYVMAQATTSARNGHPLQRAMIFEFPDDPSCFQIEDQFMFGDDLLVAPIFNAGETTRHVYLPKGRWVDYFTYEVHEGGQWRDLPANEVAGILLVRYGTTIPLLAPALTTQNLDWNTKSYLHFGTPEEDGHVLDYTIELGEIYYESITALKNLEHLFN